MSAVFAKAKSESRVDFQRQKNSGPDDAALNKLRLRLSISFLSLGVLVLVICTLASGLILYRSLTAGIDDQISLLQKELLAAIEFDAQGQPKIDDRFIRAADGHPLDSVQLFGLDGTLKYSRGKSTTTTLSRQEEEHGGLRTHSIAVPSDRAPVGYLQIQVSTRRRESAMREWLVVASWVTLSLLAALGLASYLIAGRALLPIRTKMGLIRKITQDAGHELATPVSILRSRLQLLEHELAQKSVDSNHLNVFSDALQRMSSLIDDIRILGRSERPDRQAHLSIVRFDGLVHSVISSMSPDFQKRGMHIDISAVQSVTLIGDQDSLQRVFINLLSNALRYGKENGTVRVALVQDKTHAKLTVADDGAGMPEESVPYVFDRFYRADPSRSREAGGSGLGLSIVKAIVDAHHGTVEVKSKEGEGTEFLVRLPKFPQRHPALALFKRTDDF